MSETNDPAAAVARLIALLDVEALEVDLFRGPCYDGGWHRVYGGQVVAQALVAASKTVRPERLPHSLHAYFLRPGDPQAPIICRVERDRDGQSFSTRRVVAIQHGRQIFNMAASFQVAEDGLTHGTAMPRVAGPDGLPNEFDLHQLAAESVPEPYRTLWSTRDRPIEVRPVTYNDVARPRKTKPIAHNWFRAASMVPEDSVLARCLLAYASDLTLADTCLLPHAVNWTDPALQGASIDHAVWFHASPDLNDWLLIAQESPRACGGRGLNRGSIFSRTGELVASVMQEGLIRYRG
ncbi:MAG: acyl-CoA thioesterase [Janthinobacterium lividum]